MKKETTWTEKYKIALKENLTVKDIMKLRDVGQPRALDIRQEALHYCIAHNIFVAGQKVSTEAVFEVTNKDLDYYYDRMLKEREVLKYVCA